MIDERNQPVGAPGLPGVTVMDIEASTGTVITGVPFWEPAGLSFGPQGGSAACEHVEPPTSSQDSTTPHDARFMDSCLCIITSSIIRFGAA